MKARSTSCRRTTSTCPAPTEPLFRRLASWVAPGGTLLVVSHGVGHGAGHGHGHGHAHPAGAQVQAGQIVSELPADRCSIVAAGSRTHLVKRPDGVGHVTLDDVVAHARRRPATRG